MTSLFSRRKFVTISAAATGFAFFPLVDRAGPQPLHL